MRLTDHTDYALRLLMYLATHPGRNVTIRELACVHGISHNHLTKIAHRLGRHGVLTNMRGRAGGLQLARAPEQIMLGAVIRLTEPDFALVACLGDQGGCSLAPRCRLKGALQDAAGAFFARLDKITLAKLVEAPLAPHCEQWQPVATPAAPAAPAMHDARAMLAASLS